MTSFEILQQTPEADFDLVCVGQTSIDTLENERGVWEHLPGGPALYVAAIAASIGLRTALVSCVGTDFDPNVIGWLRSLGVDTAGVRAAHGPSTRIHLVYRGADLQNVEVSEGVNASLRLDDIPRRYYATKVAHLSPAPFATLVNAAAIFKDQNCLVAFDPHADLNHVPFSETGKILNNTDLFFSNSHEAEALTKQDSLESAVNTIQQAGPKIVVTTLGKEGALLTYDGVEVRVMAFAPEQIVNYLGAGDAFQAGFLFGFLKGHSPEQCGLLGAASASCILSGTGLEKLPDARMLKRVLKHSSIEFSKPSTSQG